MDTCRQTQIKAMRPAVFVALVTALLATQPGKAATITLGGYTWSQFGGHFYTLTDFGSWADAKLEADAVALNESNVTQSYLVSINDAQENDWLMNIFPESSTSGVMNGEYKSRDGLHNIAWIGYHNPNGGFVWDNGDAVTYTNHRIGFPDGGTLAYMEGSLSSTPGKWNANPLHNTDFDAQPRGIIEAVIIPLPAAVWMALPLLGGLGVAGAVRRSRRAA